MSSRWLAGVVALALSGCVVIDASDSGGRPDPVRVGQPLTYTIAVEAISADTGVVLTDMPPAEAAPVSASASQGTCSRAAPVGCNLGALATGSRATVTIVVVPTVPGKITNPASVTSDAGCGGAEEHRPRLAPFATAADARARDAEGAAGDARTPAPRA